MKTRDAAALYRGGLYLGNLYKTEPRQYCQKQAWPLFKKSAELGNTDAMVMVGMMYMMGAILEIDGARVERDPAEAWSWYMKAAGLGNEVAMQRVADATKDGKRGEEMTEEEEMAWWRGHSAKRGRE
jgi:TPR repeat protein